jgi:hypothetical protein
MTIEIPIWLVNTGYVLGVVVTVALALLGVAFIWFVKDFEPWK